MTTEELKSTYAKLSTQELLAIIDNKFEYTDLAVSIALAELASRSVSEEEIKNYKQELVDEAVTMIHRNISDDLTVFQKHLFYFLWVPLFNFPFKQNFSDDGFVLKLKQANYYSLIGFLTFFLSGFISAAFDLSTLNSIIIWMIGFVLAYTFDETFNRKYIIRRLLHRYGQPDSGEEQDNQG